MRAVPRAIGRARTVLVFGEGETVKAVVSEVVVRIRRYDRRRRLTFRGPSAFATQPASHLNEVLVPALDEIAEGLGLKRRCFEIVLVNLAAASAHGLGVTIEGNSAEAALFLAALSAMLKFPLPGDTVTTGHLASPQGDIRAVSDIPAKLAAAIAESGVRKFVCPSIDADGSLAALSPGNREVAAEAMRKAKESIQVIAVADVEQLLRAVLDEDSVVRASLEMKFFDVGKRATPSASPTGRAIAFLAEGNEDRFWNALSWLLTAGGGNPDSIAGGKALLATWAKYHASRKKFPPNSGRRLLQLVRSLPPSLCRLRSMFPLLKSQQCCGVCRHAPEADEEDVRCFLDAASGKVHRIARSTAVVVASGGAAETGADATAEAVLNEISQESLALRIGQPIDTARAGYVVTDVAVESQDDFFDIITAFYATVLAQTGYIPRNSDDMILRADALALVERAFADRGGLAAALAEAKHAVYGGVRLILDAMTERNKVEQQEKHITAVLKQAVDPLDWDQQIAFARAVFQRIRPQLPLELQEMPPDQIAKSIEAIVLTYVRSMDRVKELLRSL
jgi:hypothetical protein